MHTYPHLHTHTDTHYSLTLHVSRSPTFHTWEILPIYTPPINIYLWFNPWIKGLNTWEVNLQVWQLCCFPGLWCSHFSPIPTRHCGCITSLLLTATCIVNEELPGPFNWGGRPLDAGNLEDGEVDCWFGCWPYCYWHSWCWSPWAGNTRCVVWTLALGIM